MARYYANERTTIRLPTLRRETGRTNKEVEPIVENLKGLHYAIRKAIPSITEYVVIPFEETLVSTARKKAFEEGKLDSVGKLTDKQKYRYEPELEMIVDTTIFPNTIVAYKEVLDRFSEYLQNIKTEQNLGIRRDMLRVENGNYFLESSQMSRMMQHFHAENSTPTESSRIIIKNPKTGKELSNARPTELEIALMREHNAGISPENLALYHEGLGMILQLETFASEYKNHYARQNNVNIETLEGRLQRDYGLGKGGIVRMLFYPQREIDYSAIYHEIAGNPRKKIVPDTGDIDIIENTRERDNEYNHKHGKSELRVSRTDKQIAISRKRSSHDEKTISYDYIERDGRLYININNVLQRLEAVKKEYTRKVLRLKVDPILPSPEFR